MMTTRLEQPSEAKTSAPPVLPSTEEHRYDPETVQRAITLASTLQANHEQTLTAAQVEAIGAEVGLDPGFVRQALSLLEAEDVTAIKPVAAATIPAAVDDAGGMQKLSPARKAAAALAPAAYGVAATALLTTGPPHIDELVAVCGLAMIIAMGAGLRSKRLGLVSGLLTSLALAVAAALEAVVHGMPDSNTLLFVLVVGPICGGLGVASAGISQAIPWLYRVMSRLGTRAVPQGLPGAEPSRR